MRRRSEVTSVPLYDYSDWVTCVSLRAVELVVVCRPTPKASNELIMTRARWGGGGCGRGGGGRLLVEYRLTSHFVTAMDTSATDINTEPGDNSLLFSTDTRPYHSFAH